MNEEAYLKGGCLQCGGPIEFPAHAVGTQTACPHCGWVTEMQPSDPSQLPEEPSLEPPAVPRRSKGLGFWIAGVILISMAAGAAYYFKRPGLSQTPAATNPPVALDPGPVAPTPEGLTVSPVKLETTQGTSLVHARGTVENRSGRPRYGLKIEVRLLDDQGATLGLGTDFLDVLEPGASRGFKVLVINPKTSRAALHRLTEQE